ncbi:hypothetical protein [Citricoccus sp. NR2]|uniref:hypothetical protein n=1 Tax=Citricoccus sp. NR2 TaxID=3004095 RepID=UPI0022DD477D|nr:hypothetical protein [Citricoccus sp. NR2]WBL20537.1 hypothetical protein O1A05_07635 [Citricoccus sp. NR2]
MSSASTQQPATEAYTVALEDGGDDVIERAFRFIGGVLTSALGGRGQDVIGESVVVRRRSDRASQLRIDVPDESAGEQILELIAADLEAMTAPEFAEEWLHAEHEGRHVGPS